MNEIYHPEMIKAAKNFLKTGESCIAPQEEDTVSKASMQDLVIRFKVEIDRLNEVVNSLEAREKHLVKMGRI